MSWDKERIAQIQLPDPADDDPHPRLLLEGRGIHAGEGFTALFRPVCAGMKWPSILLDGFRACEDQN